MYRPTFRVNVGTSVAIIITINLYYLRCYLLPRNRMVAAALNGKSTPRDASFATNERRFLNYRRVSGRPEPNQDLLFVQTTTRLYTVVNVAVMLSCSFQ